MAIKYASHVFTRDSNHLFIGRCCVALGKGTLVHVADDGALTMRTQDGSFFLVRGSGATPTEPSDEAIKAFEFADNYRHRRR